MNLSRKGNSHVCVGYRTQDQVLKAISVANELRGLGYNVDFYSGSKNIVAQLEYADRKTIPFMLMVMDENQSFVVKDMLDTNDEKGQDCKSVAEALALFTAKCPLK